MVPTPVAIDVIRLVALPDQRCNRSRPLHARALRPSCAPLNRKRLIALAIEEIDSLYRMAMSLTRNPDSAADLVQETFVRALQPTSRFRLGERGIRPWLFKILHNLFYSQAMQRTRQPMPLERDIIDQRAGAPDRPYEGDDLVSMNWDQLDQRIRAAVDALPIEQRVVLLLWAVEGLKYREIADLMGVPIGTIMSRLFRARDTMARQLRPVADERRLRNQRGRIV